VTADVDVAGDETVGKLEPEDTLVTVLRAVERPEAGTSDEDVTGTNAAVEDETSAVEASAFDGVGVVDDVTEGVGVRDSAGLPLAVGVGERVGDGVTDALGVPEPVGELEAVDVPVPLSEGTKDDETDGLAPVESVAVGVAVNDGVIEGLA